jgi:hypothetical protein
VVGLREHLAQRCRDLIARLTKPTECDVYDFSAERSRLRDRLINIETGQDVLVYLHEIPTEMQPPRADDDDRIVFTLTGDRLVSPQYEHAVYEPR